VYNNPSWPIHLSVYSIPYTYESANWLSVIRHGKACIPQPAPVYMSGSLPLPRTIKLQTHYMQISPFLRNWIPMDGARAYLSLMTRRLLKHTAKDNNTCPWRHGTNGTSRSNSLGHVNVATSNLIHIAGRLDSTATLPAYKIRAGNIMSRFGEKPERCGKKWWERERKGISVNKFRTEDGKLWFGFWFFSAMAAGIYI
jgi:hypothetical protein